ncbi:hypothetical protein V8C86DRAFT_2929528 [Haematococcus lacustris]
MSSSAASPVCTSNSLAAGPPNPTACTPADNWGSLGSQCLIPGAAFPNLPWTAPLSMACDNRVITLDLVDLSSEIQGAPGVGSYAWNKVGIMYIFKDYSDVLHVTVSLNATFRPNRGGPVDPVAPALSPSHFFVGQYMHAQPAAGYTGVGVGPTVGAVSVWDAFNLTLIYSSSFGPYTNLLQPDVFSGRDSRLWSCFTYSIDLKNVCNPSLTEYRTFDASNPGFRQPLPQGPGCYAKGQPTQLTKLSGAPFTRDLSNITNGNPLIAQMQFTVTKFSMTPGCSSR